MKVLILILSVRSLALWVGDHNIANSWNVPQTGSFPYEEMAPSQPKL